MKKLYALCILTLATVLLDIVFFHSTRASDNKGAVINVVEIAIKTRMANIWDDKMPRS